MKINQLLFRKVDVKGANRAVFRCRAWFRRLWVFGKGLCISGPRYLGASRINEKEEAAGSNCRGGGKNICARHSSNNDLGNDFGAFCGVDVLYRDSY